jgi:adenosylcobinamide-phosphate synthase
MLLAVLIDQAIGEVRVWHPLVGFGKLAEAVEARLNTWQTNSTQTNSSQSSSRQTGPESQIITRVKGALSLGALCIPFIFLTHRLCRLPFIGLITNIAVLYFAIGAKSLADHANAVANALKAGDLVRARKNVSLMVSRDTASMQEVDILRAAIESVLENGNDAIFGAFFWFLVAGAPAVVLFRLVNTLDAMWGYKNQRYLHFGWAAARLDDLLNWIPARLTALTYTLGGDSACAWQCWRTQGHTWYSPNAGPVMAAGAGALALQLGGPASYHGELKERPVLGKGQLPRQEDIHRSLALVQRGVALWIIMAVVGSFLHG